MSKSPASLLNEVAQKYFLKLTYESAITLIEGGGRKFQIQLTCQNYRVKGVSTTKKAAKQDAALKMLQQLKDAKHIPETVFVDFNWQTDEATTEKDTDSVKTNSPTATPVANGTNYVGLLNEVCQKHGLPEPTYKIETISGVQHKPAFTITCTVSSTCEAGTSTTKKDAKQKAAQKVLNALSSSNGSLNSTVPMKYNLNDHESVLQCIEKLGITIQNVNIEDIQDTTPPEADEQKKIMTKFKQCKLTNKCTETIPVEEHHIALRNRIQSISQVDKNRLLLIRSCMETMKSESLEAFITRAFKLQSLEKVWLSTKTPGKFLIVVKICVSPLITQFAIGNTRETTEQSALRKLIELMFFFVKDSC